MPEQSESTAVQPAEEKYSDLEKSLAQLKKLISDRQLAAAIEKIKTIKIPEQKLPGQLQEIYQLGLAATATKQYQIAEDCFRMVVKYSANSLDANFNLAATLRFLGQLEEAEKLLDYVVERNPRDYQAIGLRSQLRRQTEKNNHVEQLQQIAAQTTSHDAFVEICFSLAKELEDLGQYQSSFKYLKTANQLQRKTIQYNVENDLKIIEQIKSTFNQEFLKSNLRESGGEGAVFIVGMPRTGTTLVERIIGSHPQVQSLGELNDFAIELMAQLQQQQLATNDPVQRIINTAGLDFSELGQRYLNAAGAYRSDPGAKYFIDKLPFNFLYLGLIRLALPQAKIIHVKRNPMDSCYAIYKQLFRNAYPYAYQLDELGRYYIAYHQLMEHWQQLMPDAIHTVSYEQLVTNQREQTEALLKFCELPWHSDCLEFYKSNEASATASASQVRSPVYSSSVGKWQYYKQQLEPLVKQIDAAGLDWS